MEESIISLSNYNPVEIYGPNNVFLNKIQDLFPKVKIIARGEFIKVIGSEVDRLLFEKYIDNLLLQLDSYGAIQEKDLLSCLDNEQNINKDKLYMDRFKKANFLHGCYSCSGFRK